MLAVIRVIHPAPFTAPSMTLASNHELAFAQSHHAEPHVAQLRGGR